MKKQLLLGWPFSRSFDDNMVFTYRGFMTLLFRQLMFLIFWYYYITTFSKLCVNVVFVFSQNHFKAVFLNLVDFFIDSQKLNRQESIKTFSNFICSLIFILRCYISLMDVANNLTFITSYYIYFKYNSIK